jgi:hypothetical protein
MILSYRLPDLVKGIRSQVNTGNKAGHFTIKRDILQEKFVNINKKQDIYENCGN